MSTKVTLTLSDELYEYAQQWAMISQQNVSDTLTNALKVLLSTVPASPDLVPVGSLPDSDVVELSTVQMESAQGDRLSMLLEQQREGQLNYQELAELTALMQLYNQLWIRQSEALAEAVKRGIHNPLES